jgi:hypothetical protein
MFWLKFNYFNLTHFLGLWQQKDAMIIVTLFQPIKRYL